PPGLARELAEALAARGIEALDAPVSGGTIGAEAGTLTNMGGGSEAGTERARPLFEAMGKLVVHVGDHGLGQAAKLCNNLCAGINMAAIAQSLALARREGLDPAVLYELLSSSTGDSRVLRTRFPAPVTDTTPAAHGFAPMFTVDLMEKDLALARQLAAEHGLETEPLASALALYRRAQAEGHGALDYSAIALTTGGADLWARRSTDRSRRSGSHSARSGRPCGPMCPARTSRSRTSRLRQAPGACARIPPT